MNLPPLKFYSFKEAINYRNVCPLCKGEMHINDRDLATDYGYGFRQEKKRLTFFVNQREDDTIAIDPETDEVELIISNRMPALTTNGYISPIMQKVLTPPAYKGLFMHGLTIDCRGCCQYGFTIQVHFDLATQKLAGCYLNSETVSIEDGDMFHEVKNSYANEQTYYACFDKSGSDRKISLPLIPLDIDNPQDAVARIRKLLVFS